MKKVLIALFLLISISVVAQNNPTEQLPTVGDQTVQVVNAVFDKTTEAVQQLADALEVPAKHVYNILVRQQIMEAISLLLTIGLFIILFIIMIKIGYNWWQDKNDEYNSIHDTRDNYKHYDLDDGAWCMLIYGGYILLGITFIILLCMTGNIFTGIFNPEYGAIKDIMSIL